MCQILFECLRSTSFSGTHLQCVQRHKLAAGNLEGDMLGRLVAAHVNLPSVHDYRAKRAALHPRTPKSEPSTTPTKKKLDSVEDAIEINK